jgi:glutathione S-transferase
MKHAKPKLITFGISHYCEKARWALDWHGISYNEIDWPPGLHRVLLKRYGARGTTLPVLLDGKTVVQGSSAIIDWAESKVQDGVRSLNPRSANDCRVAAKPLSVCQAGAFFQDIDSTSGSMMWPVTRRIMIRMYDIRPGAASESRLRLESELDWLDAKLSDGRFYLASDRFSRADLTVASLLAFLARPKEMAVYRGMASPDTLAADIECWRTRPVICWVNEQYRAHRVPSRDKPNIRAA